jgi:hypothetical protein
MSLPFPRKPLTRWHGDALLVLEPLISGATMGPFLKMSSGISLLLNKALVEKKKKKKQPF